MKEKGKIGAKQKSRKSRAPLRACLHHHFKISVLKFLKYDFFYLFIFMSEKPIILYFALHDIFFV